MLSYLLSAYFFLERESLIEIEDPPVFTEADRRVSATAIGYMGVLWVVLFFAWFIVLDLTKICIHTKRTYKHSAEMFVHVKPSPYR